MRIRIVSVFLLSAAVLTASLPAMAQSAPGLSSDEQEMFDLAEELFSQWLSGGSELRELQGYVYKFYADTGAYVGVKDGVVYTFGGPFGGKLKSRGQVSSLLTALQDYKVQLELDVGGIDGISGVYNLTVSGEVTTVVNGTPSQPIPLSVTLNNIVAPDPRDTAEVIAVLNETLNDVAEIEGLEIIVTNNTSARITFTVSFTATVEGTTSMVDLEFDYTK